MPLETPINSLFKLEFADLYSRDGLLKIDQYFLEFLNDYDAKLCEQYQHALKYSLDKKANSELLIAVAKILEEFLVLFFNIKIDNFELQERHLKLANLYIAKRLFVQRRVAKKYQQHQSYIPNQAIDELELANQIVAYLQDETKYQQDLDQIEQYCAWALYHPDGIKVHHNGVLFKLPQKVDLNNLVKFASKNHHGLDVKCAVNDDLKTRQGFKLSDDGYNLAQALSEANYCIFCHNQNKDSCSTGLKEKDHTFKKDQFGANLEGCPLGQKISEMNLLKSVGKSIAALAIVIIDNPMVAGTGSRICNDCMKSCIYQKQDPVDIPQVETRILKDVLNLPFGFEIYSLLTRWNPLNLARVVEKVPTGYKVLVAGLGPSGYTLAHHLLNDGHLVVAVDGLKIEPLNPEISGINLQGERRQFRPIKDVSELYEELDERSIGGFGGVAEYGITVRWNKNFLKIIRLLLERRQHFRMFGGFRLGSAMDCFEALNQYNFDHVALCLGAGWPNVIDIKNNFAVGIRSASDFLMALQLTGAARKDLLSNLQLRLPILVVGAGLTAMDTACEALAYYVVQVEDFSYKYQALCQKFGKAKVEESWTKQEKQIAQEFLDHHQKITIARKNGENVTKLLQELGGATIIYRKKLIDAPAYRLNHQEVAHTFAEGVRFIEEVTPLEAVIDEFSHIKALKVQDKNNQIQSIPAQALFFAAGTSPNKAPLYEDKLKFSLDKNTLQIIDLLGEKLPAIKSAKADNIGFFVAKNHDNKMVSFFGDLHPSFNGSVVKAMASAKNGFPAISQALSILPAARNYQEFLDGVNKDFVVEVKEVNVLSDYMFELVVYAPLLARKTKLGHIFRLHNYHSLAKKVNVPNVDGTGSTCLGGVSLRQQTMGVCNTLLAMEGVAVTTYKVDKERGTISVMIVNVGGSSSLVKNFKIGEPIIFAGPSGTPTKIVANKTVLLIAGGRGIFPLAALAAEYKKNNCQVILFCGWKKNQQIVRLEDLQNCCDQLIMAVEEAPIIKLERSQDQVFRGTVTDALLEYSKNKNCQLSEVEFILTMGNEEMMHKVAKICHDDLKDQLKPDIVNITNLNNPMQCMLKGVCSQCLQKKIDSKTGEERYFYSCISQDQKTSEIDFNFLKNRCHQNSLPEKLTKSWLELLESVPILS